MLSNKGVRWVAAGWLGFITENLVMSHNRDWIISNYGDDNYHIVYNILSTAACGSIGYGFFKHGKTGGPSFPRRGPLLQLAGFSIQALGLIGLSQLAPALQVPVGFGPQAPKTGPSNGLAASGVSLSAEQPKSERKLYVRCPIDFHQKSPDGGIYGIDRVSRHPALWFMGITSLGSALTTVYAAHAVMFSFPIVFSFIGTSHRDYRFRRDSGGILTPEMEAKTSNIPFLALIQGKQPVDTFVSEIKWTNAALATVAAAGLALRRLK